MVLLFLKLIIQFSVGKGCVGTRENDPQDLAQRKC